MVKSYRDSVSKQSLFVKSGAKTFGIKLGLRCRLSDVFQRLKESSRGVVASTTPCNTINGFFLRRLLLKK
jgi:hypothetical protein